MLFTTNNIYLFAVLFLFWISDTTIIPLKELRVIHNKDGWMDYTDLWRVLGQTHTNLNTSSKTTLMTHLPTTMGVTWSVWFKWHEFHHNCTTGYWRVMTITRCHANDWIAEILGNSEGVRFFLSSGNLLTVANKRMNKSIALGGNSKNHSIFLDSIRTFNHKNISLYRKRFLVRKVPVTSKLNMLWNVLNIKLVTGDF